MLETIQLLAPLLTGPVGALTLALGVLYFGYRLIVTQLIPRHERDMDKILNSHAEDRADYRKSLETFDRRFDKIDVDLTELKVIVRTNPHLNNVA